MSMSKYIVVNTTTNCLVYRNNIMGKMFIGAENFEMSADEAIELHYKMQGRGVSNFEIINLSTAKPCKVQTKLTLVDID